MNRMEFLTRRNAFIVPTLAGMAIGVFNGCIMIGWKHGLPDRELILSSGVGALFVLLLGGLIVRFLNLDEIKNGEARSIGIFGAAGLIGFVGMLVIVAGAAPDHVVRYLVSTLLAPISIVCLYSAAFFFLWLTARRSNGDA